ncbi:MAG TPA: hypothetical protein VEJ63_22490 [Planctomycetota bacterium]|nr:hypothetical protein [Planctomycetota bacterium]
MRLWLALTVAALLLMSVRAADTSATSVDTKATLAALAPLIGGEWRVNAKWASGEPLNARSIYDWGVGKKFVTGKVFVTNPDGKEYQRYESVYGMRDGKLMLWDFSFEGVVDLSEWKLDGKRLYTERLMKSPNGESKMVQSIELFEENKFRWIVAFEGGGKKNTLIDATWVRTSAEEKK